MRGDGKTLGRLNALVYLPCPVALLPQPLSGRGMEKFCTMRTEARLGGESPPPQLQCIETLVQLVPSDYPTPRAASLLSIVFKSMIVTRPGELSPDFVFV